MRLGPKVGRARHAEDGAVFVVIEAAEEAPDEVEGEGGVVAAECSDLAL
jgi:hypothetical protein